MYYRMLTRRGNSVNCRLPQTPRTPSVGMAHYFDDIFQRHVDKGVPHQGGRRHIRRSSTARSIAARSDFDSSVNGDDDARSVTNSVHPDDPERLREKEEADSHMHRYIADQLERFKEGNGEDAYEGDEVETRAS